MKQNRYFKVCVLAFLCLFSSFAEAHTYRISAIVDTDMALDDMRALAMLLNSDMIDIPLIVTSDGASSPQAGCRNLTALLEYLNREDTRIAKGKGLGKPAPKWRSWSEDVTWFDSRGLPAGTTLYSPAARSIVNTLDSLDKDVIYLCLGPLTNLAGALTMNPEIKEKISRLVYYGAHPDDPCPGWNTDRDPDSARLVFSSGLKIYSMRLPMEQPLFFDQELYKQISDIDTDAARLVTGIHGSPRVSGLLSESHFRVWDEMVVVFLNQPSLFEFAPTAGLDHVVSLVDFKAEEVRKVYLRLLGHFADFHLSPRYSVVLKAFPDDPSMFREDIAPYVKKIIEKYGLEEWKACLLTNELHRHLGAYSLIGAKMGIRAREILDAPFDTLKVISSAGNNPPLSCMNDGLQVSTGASLGRGTIEISSGTAEASAGFFCGNRKITLKVKKEVINKIRANIKSALKEYGGLNPEYFAHIRKLAIRFWLDLDRQEIFDESTDF